MPRPSKSGIRGFFKDGEGRYRIDLRYTDPRTGVPCRYKLVFPPGTPGRAAELRARDVLAAALTGTLEPRGTVAPPTTLSTALASYRELHAGNDPAQRKRHCQALLMGLGDVPLSDVGELTLARYKRDRGRVVAPATVNRELQTLRHFLGRAVAWGWLEARPKVSLLPEPPGRVRWLSDAERVRLMAAVPTRLKRVVAAAALSGQRLGNIIALTRDRVDFDARVLTIPKTKSGKRHDVPISEALAAVLRAAMADGDALAPGTSAVFVSRLGTPYTSDGVSGMFRRVCVQAKVRDFHFHDLRHDFATRLRRAGHGLDVVQELLGHASQVMTQRYAHIGKDELHRAVEAVALALPPDDPNPTEKPRRK